MGRYIVVVAHCVVAGLDVLKKGNTRRHQGARDATRYLEERFGQGDKWLQLEGGSGRGRGAEDEAAQLVECCAFLARGAPAGAVVLLTDHGDTLQASVVVARPQAFLAHARAR